MDSIKNITGSVAEGKNFFGRAKEIARALELLEDGNSLILAAPRRVGKTSFARKIKDLVVKRGWNGVYVDLQKPTTELDFMKLFLKEVKGESWVEKYAPNALKLSYKDASLEFNKQKQNFYRKVEDALPHDKDTLIIFDEFIIFLDDVLRKKQDKENDMDNIAQFLNWLKGLRQTTGSKIRWIFCSSISIEHYLYKNNFTKRVNDLASFKIDELKGDEPRLLVKALADSKKISFPDEQIQYLLDKLNWLLPYFIQILFKEIVDVLEDEKVVSSKIIDEAYKNLLDVDIYFNTWTERLSYLDDEKRLARMILNELSRAKAGREKKNLQDLAYVTLGDSEKVDKSLQVTLKQLESDGYIMSSNDKYTFRSPLLRDYWFGKFEK
jgi:hypothetical protein